MAVRVMLFDFGHVLAQPPLAAVDELIEMSGRSPTEFWRLWPVGRPQMDHGELPVTEYWRAVAMPGTDDEVIAAMAQLDVRSWTNPAYDESMLQLARDLRSDGTEVGVLSNTSDAVGRAFEQNELLSSLCSAGFFLSSDHGTFKPNPAIYAWVDDELHEQYGEIEVTFADDKPDNVARASSTSTGQGIPDAWTGIVFETAQKLRDDLRAHGWLRF